MTAPIYGMHSPDVDMHQPHDPEELTNVSLGINEDNFSEAKDMKEGPYSFPEAGHANALRFSNAVMDKLSRRDAPPTPTLCSTVRSYLAMGDFTCVLEVVCVLSVANLLLSMACIAAESSGWFLGYNKFSYGGALNLIDVNIGWDRFSIDVNGGSAVTTRFIDDLSPAGYALGCLTFFGHVASCLVSLCAVALLYGVVTNSKVGRLPSGYTHARLLSIALTSLSVYLLAFAVMGLPIAISRDFKRAFGSTPSIQGFQVRAVWAYGLSVMVTFASLFNGLAIMRRASCIDRAISSAALPLPTAGCQ